MLARRYWMLFGLAAVVVVVVVIGMALVVVGRRHRSALDQVDREIAARRFGAARAAPDRAVDPLDGAGRGRLSARRVRRVPGP